MSSNLRASGDILLTSIFFSFFLFPPDSNLWSGGVYTLYAANITQTVTRRATTFDHPLHHHHDHDHDHYSVTLFNSKLYSKCEHSLQLN